jgi:hypothetical protein
MTRESNQQLPKLNITANGKSYKLVAFLSMPANLDHFYFVVNKSSGGSEEKWDPTHQWEKYDDALIIKIQSEKAFTDLFNNSRYLLYIDINDKGPSPINADHAPPDPKSPESDDDGSELSETNYDELQKNNKNYHYITRNSKNPAPVDKMTGDGKEKEEAQILFNGEDPNP